MTKALIQELSYPQDSSRHFETVRDHDWPIWLDSGAPYTDQGRFDIIVADPIATLVTRGAVTEITRRDEVTQSLDNPLDLLRPGLAAEETVIKNIPFAREMTASRNAVKDRAENMMIVDLLRSDLGKVCETGSVRVPALFEIESFAMAHHLVSTVTGTLRHDRDNVDLLQACFPGGSITGAPKLRAMEIIEELELHRRGVYCGSIGYIGGDGGMDLNIAIRTLIYSDGRVRFWVGGGIVADSVMEAEFQETLDKAKAMLLMLRQEPQLRSGARL